MGTDIPDQLLVPRPQGIEEGQLTVSGKQLVVPLQVKQCGSGDSSGIGGETFRRPQTFVEGSSLPEAELAEDYTAEPTAQGRRHRDTDPCPHGHSQIGEAVGMHNARNAEGANRRQPVGRHAVEDGIDSFRDNAGLIFRGRHRPGNSFAVVGAVYREGGDTTAGCEPASQGADSVASLVPTSAVPEQDQGWR